MFNRTRAFFSFFAAAAALVLGPAAPAPLPERHAPVLNASKRRNRGLFNDRPYPSFLSLVGKSSLRLSVAQGKRNATKSRNQVRHKRHVRG
jgi:hypothetical protein